ncbi:hypothetical protein N3K66_008059 [Trichothecium roseum]|uniref:Uncharacterized protein n=1 Tax=Trichothecium roseum TaxID=47278 RepID=A0ACC0USW6_9HYPO|nr:hypothetical protein N3K66_008059 [Trichothecium roseum]
MSASICDACRAIDFEKALEIPVTEFSGWTTFLLDKDADRFAYSPSPGCPLCKLLESTLCSCETEWSDPGIREDASRQPYELSAFSFLRNCRWAEDVPGAQDSHVLLAPRGVVSTGGAYTKWVGKGEAGYVVCLPKKREVGLCVPQTIADKVDFARAKLWLRNCRTSHGSSCNDYSESVPGTMVIDCETLKIVELEPGMLWVALSYVWGRRHDQADNENPDDAESGKLPDDVPKTIQDAIQVTKELGYKYLWVDQYCIAQQDEAHKQNLISKMDVIYRGADLTIVAAAGQDADFGLPGVGTTSRKKQQIVELDSCTILGTGPDPILETKGSRWWSRGWTFQEGLLSRRRLVFTEHQSWFECGEGSWMEALGGLELVEKPDQLQRIVSNNMVPSLNSWLLSHLPKPLPGQTMKYAHHTPRLQQFSMLAMEYSKRDLSFDADALNAFAGVSRYLRNSSEPQLSHVLGIPYVPGPLNGPDSRRTAEEFMFYFLSWTHSSGETTPRRRECFPSWTWAGWVGGVSWMTNKVQCATTLDQHMEEIWLEVDGKPVPPEDYPETFDRINGLPTCPDVALYFRAQVVPSSLFSWGTYVEARDTYEQYESEEEGAEEEGEDGKSDASGGEDQESDHRGGSNEASQLSEEDAEEKEDGKSDASDGEAQGSDRQDGSDRASQLPEEEEEEEESLLSEDDPNDWGSWTVGKHLIWDRTQPPDCGPLAFVQNLEEGKWDCLLLGDYCGNAGFSHRRFLLVVEWLGNGDNDNDSGGTATARRVGSIVLNKQYYLDAKSEFFDRTGLEWKSVRLV